MGPDAVVSQLEPHMLKNQPSQIAAATATQAGGYAATRLANGSPAAGECGHGRMRVIPGTRPDVRGFAAEVVLIRNWLQIIRWCALVTAHGTFAEHYPSCEELLGQLEAVETAITTRIATGADLLDALAGWEASLLHLGTGIPPTDCLVCERAKAVPDDLPAEYAWAIRVVDEAA